MIEQERIQETSSGDGASFRVSVLIKALNEEEKIERAVASALAAVDRVGGEVVVADSLSSDRTVEIASKFPVRVVQLCQAEDRCCGVGPQLGFQYSSGEYVYIMDGDMRMHAGFLEDAVQFLDEHLDVAGVGGLIIEQNTSSMEYAARVERGSAHMASGQVDRLDMGGLYRRSALADVGYMSDRNLHSYEEFELGVRLRSRGGLLWRIDKPSCDHWGHDVPAHLLLARRWRSGYAFGLGEMLRASIAAGTLGMALRDVRELRVYAVVLVWTFATLFLLGATAAGVGSAWLATLSLFSLPALMLAKKKSLPRTWYAMVSWFHCIAGMIVGLAKQRRDPRGRINARVISDWVRRV